MHRDPQREAQPVTGPADRPDEQPGVVIPIPQENTATLPLLQERNGAQATGRGTLSVRLPIGIAMLVVAHGPNAGARFLLDRDITTAGRHPDSDIFLDDITVSRQHAQFQRTPTGYTITDAGSLNGVYVNRQRVHTTMLANGDEVQIGKFRMTFHIS